MAATIETPPRILLTGITGQLGWELFRELSTLGAVVAASRTGESPLPGVKAIVMDFSKPESLGKQVRELRPDLIVNAAAYTAVDRAEAEGSLAMTVNAEAPGVLAREAKRLGALLIHCSTDSVFDGRAGHSYGEDDAPRPLNAYGKTKLAGEQAIQAAGADHLIFRTGWVYGARGNNFLRTMLRLFTERDALGQRGQHLEHRPRHRQAPDLVVLAIDRDEGVLPRQDVRIPLVEHLLQVAVHRVLRAQQLQRGVHREHRRLPGLRLEIEQ